MWSTPCCNHWRGRLPWAKYRVLEAITSQRFKTSFRQEGAQKFVARNIKRGTDLAVFSACLETIESCKGAVFLLALAPLWV